jgi:(p)ppGpp synthase/HD superfamily hydrolase
MAFIDEFFEAQRFAAHAHAHRTKDGKPQLYGKFRPYTDHLKDVAHTLLAFGFGDGRRDPRHSRLLLGAWLHDVLEDTTVTREELEGNSAARSATSSTP